MIYGWPILTAVHHTDSLANIFNPFSLSLVLCLVRATDKDKALVYNYLQEPHFNCLQKESLGDKLFSETTLSQDLVKCIKCCKL